MNARYKKYVPDEAPLKICGGLYDKRLGFYRLPAELAAVGIKDLAVSGRYSSGIRILFKTNSSRIKLTGYMSEKCVQPTHTPIAGYGFTLKETVNDVDRLVCNLHTGYTTEGEFDIENALLGGMRSYTLYLPLHSCVDRLDIWLDEDSRVERFNKYRNIPPVLYYGSSITQGACATRPDNSYAALVAEHTRIDYRSLGFAGCARGESEIARYIAEQDFSVFVCDYDHNAPTVEHLLATHLPLYKTIRSAQKHKNTPIVFMSSPPVWSNSGMSAELDDRFKIIEGTYSYAKSAGDNNVYLIDGRKYFPSDMIEHCYIDGIHPTDLGSYFIARAVINVLDGLGL